MRKHPPNILVLSSHVCVGAVGLVIATPCLQAMGCSVSAIPTCVLSNHPGLGRPQGTVLDADELTRVLDGLTDNGFMERFDGIMTGYFAHAGQIAVARDAVERVKGVNPRALYLCDPVIGDAGKGVYVRDGVAENIRKDLLPLADIVTPNAFELAWLTGHRVTGPTEAEAAAREIDGAVVAATGVPHGRDRIATALVSPDTAHWVTADRQSDAPHGTGDALAALLLGCMAWGMNGDEAIHRSVVGVETLMAGAEDELGLPTAGLGDLLTEVAP